MHRVTRLLALLLFCAWALPGAGQTTGSAPTVVASIKPLHGLVAAVMEGVGAPQRLLPDGASPHTYALRPSDMRQLERADAIFWIGPELETFLVKPLDARQRGAQASPSVSLLAAPGVQLLPARGLDGEDTNHGQSVHQVDAHIWLDPANLRAMVAMIANRLATLDPANAGRYQANAARHADRIAAMDAEIAGLLVPLKDRPYTAFHDAYQYFERRYGLRFIGALSVSPAVAPGAKHVLEIRQRIRETGARCVFAEPQFRAGVVKTLVQDTGAQYATLDPLGLDVKEGPEATLEILRGLARDMAQCLGRP